MRPSGIAEFSFFISAGSFMVERLMGVATAPGPTPTTRMLCGASSTPALRVSMRIPPLERQYAVLPGIGQGKPVAVNATHASAEGHVLLVKHDAARCVERMI